MAALKIREFQFPIKDCNQTCFPLRIGLKWSHFSGYNKNLLMLRLSKLTDYAVVIMAYLSQYPGLAVNAKSIAEYTGIALPTTSKLLKRLSHEGLLRANRGIKGGYQLAYPATNISLGTVIQTLEGQIALTECSHNTRVCCLEKQCTIRDNWRRISLFIQSMLMHISLADLIQPFKQSQLAALLNTEHSLHHLVPENNP